MKRSLLIILVFIVHGCGVQDQQKEDAQYWHSNISNITNEQQIIDWELENGDRPEYFFLEYKFEFTEYETGITTLQLIHHEVLKKGSDLRYYYTFETISGKVNFSITGIDFHEEGLSYLLLTSSSDSINIDDVYQVFLSKYGKANVTQFSEDSTDKFFKYFIGNVGIHCIQIGNSMSLEFFNLEVGNSRV